MMGFMSDYSFTHTPLGDDSKRLLKCPVCGSKKVFPGAMEMATPEGSCCARIMNEELTLGATETDRITNGVVIRVHYVCDNDCRFSEVIEFCSEDNKTRQFGICWTFAEGGTDDAGGDSDT